MNETVVFRKILVPIVLFVLAYEWLVSGIDKLVSGSFVPDMHKQFAQAVPDMQYQFYARIVQNIYERFPAWLAWAVELGEVFVGLAFLFLAIRILRNRLQSYGLFIGIAAGLVSAFMNLNFFFYQGGFFFINSSDPFDEGIPVDLIMCLMELAIAVAFFFIVRARTAKQE